MSSGCPSPRRSQRVVDPRLARQDAEETTARTLVPIDNFADKTLRDP